MCGSKLFGGLFGGGSKIRVIEPPKQPIRQEAKAPTASVAIDRAQQNQNAVSGGIANTLYTGATGVDDSQLKLGKKTLLGG